MLQEVVGRKEVRKMERGKEQKIFYLLLLFEYQRIESNSENKWGEKWSEVTQVITDVSPQVSVGQLHFKPGKFHFV